MSHLLTIHLITGIPLLIVSFMMKLWPPKKINHFYGYRTPRSMKNQQAWGEANTYSGNLLMWAGISTLFVQAISFTLIRDYFSVFIVLGYYIIFIFISIVLTERRLKLMGY
jgi:uncharacterized membrane protein